jgi:hypothetical protein
MSGRSAYVRAKTGQIAEKRARSQQQQQLHYLHTDEYIYGNNPNKAVYITPNFVAPDVPPPRRRHSVSSGGSTFTYMPAVATPRKPPRPIVIASAVEKSDFRTHLDGMSKSVRGKLGRLIKGGDENRAPPPPPTLLAPVASTGSDSGSRSTGMTPSVTAVPSLEPGTPPGETSTLFSGSSLVGRDPQPPKKHQHSTSMPIRRFEGGGKGPQPGWKLLSNVR